MSSRPGRAIRWAALGASLFSPLASPLLADVLFLRDGTQRAGALSACAGETCGLSGSTVPRAAIAAIAFGDITASPPAPTQFATDELRLVGGDIVISPIVGISLGVVATESGSHDRDQVDWVLFAAPSSGQGEEPPVAAPTAPPTPTPAPTPTPTRAPTPTPAPSPTPPPTPTQPPPPPGPPHGEPGALWTGTILGRHFGTADDTASEWRFEVDVRLREYRVPLICPGIDANGRPTAARVGTHSVLVSEGSRISNRFSSSNQFFTCSATGETAVTDSPELGARSSGALWYKSVDRDLTACLGVDFPPGSTLYVVSLGTGSENQLEVQCSNGAVWELGMVSPVLGWFPAYGRTECSDRQVRLAEGNGGILRGSYRGPCTGCCPQSEVSWTICRQGVACPPPPPLEEEVPPAEPRRPCDETAPDRAQIDLLFDQWRSVAESLAAATAEVGRVQREADQWQGDFEHAMRDCNLWGIAQILVAVGTSGLVPGQPAPFTAFVNYGTQLDKIASGDPSWLLPTNNLEAGGQEWVSLETLYDAWVLANANLGSSAPAELRDRLRGCGAPTLDAVLDGAYAYLRLMEELGPLAQRMHERQNRLRDLWERLEDFCLSHRQACEDFEACRNGTTAP